MPIGLPAVEQLFVTEDWELARQVIVEAPEFSDIRGEIENEHRIALGDLESIIDLPEASFRRLKEAILERVESRVREYNDAIHQKVCVEWDYCNKRESRKVEIAEYIAAVLDIVVTGGAVALAALLLKREYLDKLCRCPKK